MGYMHVREGWKVRWEGEAREGGGEVGTLNK
jgi:hypothetical protein